ncbi:hypothetical protein ACWGDX_13510 [Streptomyces sp. NPDC055025]
MSLIPTLNRHGRHRAVGALANLEHQVRQQRIQLVGASEAIRKLQQDRRSALDAVDHLRVRLGHVEQENVRLGRAVEDLTLERNQLDEELAAVKRRFGAQLAADANQHAVTVPAGIRDTSAPEDQATAPIDVMPLWQALGVRATRGNPNPAHIPPAA